MSPLWQWVFAIIGLVAFIMAFPFFLQLIFGQPRIGVVFSQDDSSSEGRLLTISISNPPIDNRLLQALRVTRLPAQDVFIAIRIFDALTGKVTADTFVPEIKYSPSDASKRINLPPSIMLVKVKLARWQRATNSAVLYADKTLPLQEGACIVTMRIDVDGKGKICRPVSFYVGKKETDLVWDEEIIGKYLA